MTIIAHRIDLVSEADVRKVITTHDPEHLLRMGAPDDEYTSEIKHIAEAINNYRPTSPVKVANIVSLVWFWHFGDWAEPVQYSPYAMEMARDLWEIIKVNQTPEELR